MSKSHSAATTKALRAAFVFDRMTLESAASVIKISTSTASRWKAEAKKGGDDWDKERGAYLLAGQDIESMATQMLADYLLQHKALMANISNDCEASAMKKVEMLASLADSFNKTVVASKRVLKDVGEYTVALEVIKMLEAYIREQLPEHSSTFLEMLDPFCSKLARHFSSKNSIR